MFSEELAEKSLAELRAMGRAREIPNLNKLRKGELIAILSGEEEAPKPAKRGRKPSGKNAKNDETATEPAEPAAAPAESGRQNSAAPVQEPAASEAVVFEQPEAKPEMPARRPRASGKRKSQLSENASEPVELQQTSEPEKEKTPESTGEKQNEQADPGQEEHSSRDKEKETKAETPAPNGRFHGKETSRYTRNRYERNQGGYRQQGQNGQRTGGYQNRRYEAAPGEAQGRRNSQNPAPRTEERPRYTSVNPWENEGENKTPYYNAEYGTSNPAVPKMLETEDCPKVQGILEVLPDGYGFLRVRNYYSSPKDIYLSITQIRRFSLRTGDLVCGRARPHREGDKFDALMYIDSVNGVSPDENAKRPNFEDLVPVFPNERYTLEVPGEKNELAVRLIDLIAPIGKGQRAMIVAQPKAGKTTLLKQIAAGIAKNYPESHLMVLLIDERPEEVTDMQRSIQGEVIYSTFDELPEHHTRIAEMVQERAMRLVERGKDVVILLDSLTRLTRAYNLVIPPTGRTLSGGMDPGALHKPKRFFGAARNIEGGGSLTVVATALIETGSRMDDIVYEEFKGTGNMEIHLDRKLAEKRIFPAIDIYKSGTRREDLLLSREELEGVYMLRRFMAGGGASDVTEQVIPMLQKTTTNEEFVAKIKDWIRIYEKKGFTLSGGQNRYGQ